MPAHSSPYTTILPAVWFQVTMIKKQQNDYRNAGIFLTSACWITSSLLEKQARCLVSGRKDWWIIFISEIPGKDDSGPVRGIHGGWFIGHLLCIINIEVLLSDSIKMKCYWYYNEGHKDVCCNRWKRQPRIFRRVYFGNKMLLPRVQKATQIQAWRCVSALFCSSPEVWMFLGYR